MKQIFRNPMVLGVLAVIVLIIITSTVAIVPETKQAVILRFGKPFRTINAYRPGEQFGQTNAGPILRIPLVDRIVWVDKRVQAIDLDDQPVLSADQYRLNVDAFARFRVVNPLQMVVTVGTQEQLAAALSPLLVSTLRNELGKRKFEALLSPERGQVMENIQIALQALAKQYGVEIVDVRIRHADLPSGSPLDSALERMRTARQKEATVIRAQAQKQAQIIQAGADAEAAKVYAESYSKDPKFYDFYRAMQSYQYTFGVTPNSEKQGDTSIILTPGNGYLRQFEARER